MSWVNAAGVVANNAGAGYISYEQIKNRNTGEVVVPNACGKIVYTFVKEGHMDGPGSHAGACGVKKDHKRVFSC